MSSDAMIVIGTRFILAEGKTEQFSNRMETGLYCDPE